jgi:hypothetical protein
MKSIHLALSAALFAATPFIATAQDHTLGGNPIPEGQMTAVQERCAELQAQQGATGTQVPETSVDPTVTDKAEQAMGGSADGKTLDLSTVTLQQCIEGGFTVQPANSN